MKIHYDMPQTLSEPSPANESDADKLIRYLKRSVNGVCYAALEEQLAAQLICSLQQQVQHLERQAGKPDVEANNPDLVQQLQTLTTEFLTLKLKYDELLLESRRDSRRIAFCLQETVCASGDMLIADLDQEPVIDGDYRSAIDRLMTN